MRLLRAPRVLTGRGSDVIANGEVLIDGTSIVGVGPQGTLTIPADTEIVAFADATIMPGMIDAHVHIGFEMPGGPDTGMDGPLLVRMVENCRKLVAAGVTTARDLGNRGFHSVLVRDAIEDGLLVGPHLCVATRPITVTGGHCSYMGGEADGAGDIRTVARENLRAGADCLKIMVTGGAMTPSGPPMWEAQYSIEEIRIVIEEAASRGKHVAAHAPGSAGIRRAAQAGVATIEHCSFRSGPELTSGGIEMDVVETMLRNGVAVCPTFSGAFHQFAAAAGSQALDDVLGRVATMHHAGVKVIAGTDSGFVMRGVENRADDYVAGLEMLAAAGLDNASVIAAATTWAAQAIGLGDHAGSLEAGKRADVIVVRGNPLEELACLRNIALVLVSGRAVTQRDVETVATSVAPLPRPQHMKQTEA